MTEEFNLSNEEQEILMSKDIYFRGFPTAKVKKFIEQVDKASDDSLTISEFKIRLYKLAGDKFIPQNKCETGGKNGNNNSSD